METLNGFSDPIKLEITSHSVLGIAILSFADSLIFVEASGMR
jgi:hypothetical protein